MTKPLDQDAIAAALDLWSAVVALCLMWTFGIKPLLLAAFRDRIFELRAELFDIAADGDVDFDHPAYVELRRTLNGFIRFGHRYAMLPLLICLVASRWSTIARDATARRLDADRSIASLGADVAAKVLDIRARAHWSIFLHLIRSTPLLFVLVPVVAILTIAGAARQVARWLVGIPAIRECIATVDALASTEGGVDGHSILAT